MSEMHDLDKNRSLAIYACKPNYINSKKKLLVQFLKYGHGTQ